MNVYKLIIAVAVLLLAVSCKSQYEALLNSNDADVKYEAAFGYFNEGKYSKAAALFESLSSQAVRRETIRCSIIGD